MFLLGGEKNHSGRKKKKKKVLFHIDTNRLFADAGIFEE